MNNHPAIEEHASLKRLNTFGIDVKARYFSTVNSHNDACVLLGDKKWQSTKKLILGGGSNILLTQDFDGLVIKNNIQGIDITHETDKHIWLRIGAGVNWHQLVLHTIKENYQGIENLSLIPGTVGAAPIQNIGAYGTELKDTFISLDAIKMSDATSHQFSNTECDLAYRHSVFKTTHKNQFFITHVTLKLNKDPQLNINYGALKNRLDELEISTPSVKSVSDAVIHIRQSKLPDPAKIGNAGSFFKNPMITAEQFNRLKASHPDIPHFQTDHEKIKIPAAWLIEQCGWKGKSLGNVGVHNKQALVLINHGQANGHEVKALAEKIQDSVQQTFDIELNPEVNFI